MTFFNYNLSLNKTLKRKQTEDNNDVNDDSIDLNENIEEIKEELYLSAYYHMDRGVGNIIEDITDNKNDAIIGNIYNKNINNTGSAPNKKKDKEKKEEIQKDEDMKEIWGDILEENSPLEFEDKWGRRVPPPHGIIFKKEHKTKISIKYSKSLQHIKDKFTIEFWIKLNDSRFETIFSIEKLHFDIYNGLFKLSYDSKEIPGENYRNYNLPLDQYIHITVLYNKSLKGFSLLINCEEITKFNLVLSNIEENSYIIFGNGNFEGEMTEIRIWNQIMPVEYIKENYKTPLPILAENKKKLRVNFDNKIKKNKVRENRVFEFGEKNKLKNITDSDSKGLTDNRNNQQLNNNEFGNKINAEEYPSLDLVNSNNENTNEIITQNEMKYNGGNFSTTNNNDFVFQEKDFNFDQ